MTQGLEYYNTVGIGTVLDTKAEQGAENQRNLFFSPKQEHIIIPPTSYTGTTFHTDPTHTSKYGSWNLFVSLLAFFLLF